MELGGGLGLVFYSMPSLLTCDVGMRLGKRLTVLGVAIPSPMDVVGHDIEPINILNHIHHIKTAKIPLY